MYSSHQAPRCWLSSMSVNLLYRSRVAFAGCSTNHASSKARLLSHGAPATRFTNW
jgi:hypothetical protein